MAMSNKENSRNHKKTEEFLLHDRFLMLKEPMFRTFVTLSFRA